MLKLWKVTIERREEAHSQMRCFIAAEEEKQVKEHILQKHPTWRLKSILDEGMFVEVVDRRVGER